MIAMGRALLSRRCGMGHARGQFERVAPSQFVRLLLCNHARMRTARGGCRRARACIHERIHSLGSTSSASNSVELPAVHNTRDERYKKRNRIVGDKTTRARTLSRPVAAAHAKRQYPSTDVHEWEWCRGSRAQHAHGYSAGVQGSTCTVRVFILPILRAPLESPANLFER